MVVLMSKRKNRLIAGVGVFALLCYLAWPFLQFSLGWTQRFAGGQHPFSGGPIHPASQAILPTVSVESGHTVCCQMEFCDFRFPLPKGAGLSAVDPVSGGFDTIKGAIYVTNANGSQVDLEAYAKRIWESGFRVHGSSARMFNADAPDGGLRRGLPRRTFHEDQLFIFWRLLMVDQGSQFSANAWLSMIHPAIINVERI